MPAAPYDQAGANSTAGAPDWPRQSAAPGRTSERISALEEAIKRIAAEEGQLGAEQAEARSGLEALAGIAGDEAAVAALRREVEAARLRAAEARAVADGIEREEQARKARLEQIATEHANWAGRQVKAGERLSALAGRRDELTGELEQLDDQPEAFEERRKALLEKAHEAENNRSGCRRRIGRGRRHPSPGGGKGTGDAGGAFPAFARPGRARKSASKRRGCAARKLSARSVSSSAARHRICARKPG